MSDPQEPDRGLYQPTVGSDVGTWYQPCNANFGATGSMFGNVATIGLTNAPVTLTTPPNSGAAWSGPYQSQSGILRFTGTLSGNVTVTIPVTGYFIVENLCTVGSFYVALASSAPGQVIGAPPGEACHVYCDGTNVKYVNMGRVGSYLDMAVSAVPAWIANSTVPPYLKCDGTVYTATAVYGVGNPAPLLNLLGSTFGGNGITTFGVPDLRARVRIPLGEATGRVTTAGSGIDGTTINSGGGTQNETIAKANLPVYNFPVTDPGHSHTIGGSAINGLGGGGSNPATNLSPNGGNNQAFGPTTNQTTGITVGTGGSGTPLTTMPPTLVSGLSFIKT